MRTRRFKDEHVTQSCHCQCSNQASWALFKHHGSEERRGPTQRALMYVYLQTQRRDTFAYIAYAWSGRRSDHEAQRERERERERGITTVEIDSSYHVVFVVVPSGKHLCHYGCELLRMRPGKNPNRQLDNLRPAALDPAAAGPSSLGANYITKTVFNQVLLVSSPTPPTPHTNLPKASFLPSSISPSHPLANCVFLQYVR